MTTPNCAAADCPNGSSYCAANAPRRTAAPRRWGRGHQPAAHLRRPATPPGSGRRGQCEPHNGQGSTPPCKTTPTTRFARPPRWALGRRLPASWTMSRMRSALIRRWSGKSAAGTGAGTRRPGHRHSGDKSPRPHVRRRTRKLEWSGPRRALCPALKDESPTVRTRCRRIVAPHR